MQVIPLIRPKPDINGDNLKVGAPRIVRVSANEESHDESDEGTLKSTALPLPSIPSQSSGDILAMPCSNNTLDRLSLTVNSTVHQKAKDVALAAFNAAPQQGNSNMTPTIQPVKEEHNDTSTKSMATDMVHVNNGNQDGIKGSEGVERGGKGSPIGNEGRKLSQQALTPPPPLYEGTYTHTLIYIYLLHAFTSEACKAISEPHVRFQYKLFQ